MDLSRRRRLDEAKLLLEKALALRPDDTAALYQMAQLVQAKGDNAEAVSLLERVINRAPDFTPAHVVLARLYYKVGRASDAERERATIQRLTEEQQKKRADSRVTRRAADTAIP